ncbi:kinase-like protein [Fusarium austroafricanum]|uniref:Kinase-like protein n=1 Tax=Fusarium austroafricanum TaxID=2364996 RepID=A0A8H4KIT0_9HYPO|nr:kinase-like protein [Fusarium austroafricanum]
MTNFSQLSSPSPYGEHMELFRYLEAQVNHRSELDDLVNDFCRLISLEAFKMHMECFYETGTTDFTNVNKDLLGDKTIELRGGNSGVLVSKSLASLPGKDAHGLTVRHSMLSKYDDPEDDDFMSVLSSLTRTIQKWENQRQDRDFFTKSTSSELSNVSIQTIVFKARKLQLPDTAYQRKPWNFMETSFLKTQPSLQSKRESLTNTVNTTATIARSTTTNSDIANKFLGDMQDNFNDVLKDFQEIILLGSTIDLKSVLVNDFAKLLGVTHAVELKQQIKECDTAPDVMNIPYQSIQFRDPRRDRLSRHWFQNATVSGLPVLVETFRYDPDRRTATALSERRLSLVRRFAYQLTHQRRPSCNILPCIGYYYHRDKKHIGLVFELGREADHNQPAISLKEPYKNPAKSKLSLGYRLKLAYSLAAGLDGLHRIGWIYKDLNSMNVLLIASNLTRNRTSSRRVDSARPYPPEAFLFGFEWARPQKIEVEFGEDLACQTSIYRHPDRWSRPREDQTRAEDIYSLMLKILRDNGPQIVGNTFVAVVKACLNFKEFTEGCTALESYQKLKPEVVEVLKRLVDADI